jgi:hypothetical protein
MYNLLSDEPSRTIEENDNGINNGSMDSSVEIESGTIEDGGLDTEGGWSLQEALLVPTPVMELDTPGSKLHNISKMWHTDSIRINQQ